MRRRRGLTVGLLAQDTVFDRPDRTARETYELALGAERAEAVPLRSLGLIGPRDLDRPVGELSVGQRRRLALALLVADPPELLLLDEPTNHLSPRLCDELEEALGTGPGAIVVASHDRWLRSRWPGRELRLPPDRQSRPGAPPFPVLSSGRPVGASVSDVSGSGTARRSGPEVSGSGTAAPVPSCGEPGRRFGPGLAVSGLRFRA